MAEPPSRRAAKRLRDRRGDSLSALLELVIATGRGNAKAHILEQTVEVGARGAELAQEVVGRLGHRGLQNAGHNCGRVDLDAYVAIGEALIRQPPSEINRPCTLKRHRPEQPQDRDPTLC